MLGLKDGQIAIGTEVEGQNPNNLQRHQKWTFIIDESNTDMFRIKNQLSGYYLGADFGNKLYMDGKYCDIPDWILVFKAIHCPTVST